MIKDLMYWGYADLFGIMIFFIIFPFFVYLIGSIPFGLILSKIFIKKDIRAIGSGNIGATNVLRTGNKILALFTLLLDAGKGMIVAYLIYELSLLSHGPSLFELMFKNYESHRYVTFLASFTIIGHCFPIWLNFKGGKGVATSLGVLLVAVPYAGLAACGAWLLTFAIFRISSLAALIALAIAPIITFFIYGMTTAIVCALITALIWLRHKENLKRLIAGTEPKIGGKKDVV